MLPTVAIIGRPNTGKSTLFNALIGERRAIVSDLARTTRDSLIKRIEGEFFQFYLVDTAGLTDADGDSLEAEIQTQAHVALANADVLLFLVDGKAEITSDDQKICDLLRRSTKPVLFVANKIDDGDESRTWNLAQLGLGMPFCISAKNYVNIYELIDQIEEQLSSLNFEPNIPEEKEEVALDEVDEGAVENKKDDVVKIAFVGRPNVGKSSLMNQLLGEERAVVSNISGTTRDAIDSQITLEDGTQYTLIDTAGLRKRGKIERNFEFWGSVRTQRAIERADVCVLLIDALDGVTHQDLAVAGKILDAGKGVLVCVNKFDLAAEKSRTQDESDERELAEVPMWDERLDKIRERYLEYLSDKIRFMNWAPALFISAKTGKGTKDILLNCQKIYEERQRRISTAELNRFIPEVYYGHVQPSVGTKIGKIKFASQVDTAPPKFIFHVNNEKAFHYSYRRYVENKLREKYGFHGTPIVVHFRDAMEEFKGKKRKK